MGGHPVETRNFGVVPGIATSGTGVVWDLSAQGYTIVGSTTDSILDPAATPYAADFPDANIAVRLVDQFGYYRATENEVLDLGMRLSAGSPSTVYTDPARVVQFPAAVGDVWTDQVVNGATTMQWEITILAEGTIQLADRTIPDAVLVQRRIITGSTTVSITWYRRSNALVPLGNLLSNGTVIIRTPLDITTSVASVTEPAFMLAPNPADRMVVLTGTEGTPLGVVRLLDATGRQVRVFPNVDDRLEIELNGLPNGSYWLRTNSGRTFRFVKAEG
jgi:hypothetical protein